MRIFFNLKHKVEKSIKKFLLKKVNLNKKMFELTHEENIIVLENNDKEEIGYFRYDMESIINLYYGWIDCNGDDDDTAEWFINNLHIFDMIDETMLGI
jgi:hypothetical protein